MNNLQIFNFEEREIRTIEIDGEIWFVGKDIASALDYVNLSDAILSHIDDIDRVNSKEKLNRDSLLSLNLGQRGGWLINESGMYSLIMCSKLEKAKKFKRWVTSEVLPSIRQTGSYNTQQTPRTYIESLEALIIAEREKEKLVKENKNLQIQLDESKDWYSVKRVAILNNISWKSINWRKLKNTSEYMQYQINKIFDANYGNVNTYHIDIWKQEYPGLKYE